MVCPDRQRHYEVTRPANRIGGVTFPPFCAHEEVFRPIEDRDAHAPFLPTRHRSGRPSCGCRLDSNRPTKSSPPSRPASLNQSRVRPPRRRCQAVGLRPLWSLTYARSPKKPDAPPARLFKPSLRPPVALLIVFDNGADDGETVRVRGERFVIGRSEGDLLLPHDGQVSGRHAELVRHHNDDGSWDWVLTDLGSTNGTFVRAGSAVLKDGQELLIGRTRYRFDAGMTAPTPDGDAPALPRTTVTWDSDAGPPLPSLVELLPSGVGARLPLLESEYWAGADRTACAIVPTDDPFVSPRHARLTRDAKGRWHIANNKSVNGVWLRVEQMELASSCQFQIGEQRFSFKVY